MNDAVAVHPMQKKKGRKLLPPDVAGLSGLDPDALLRMKDTCRLVGLAPSTGWREIKAGRFVPRVRPSPGRTVFRVRDVLAWIDAMTERAVGTAP